MVRGLKIAKVKQHWRLLPLKISLETELHVNCDSSCMCDSGWTECLKSQTSMNNNQIELQEQRLRHLRTWTTAQLLRAVQCQQYITCLVRKQE